MDILTDFSWIGVAVCVALGAVYAVVHYFIGKKHRYFHAVFHVFVLLGNIAIFIGTYNFNAAVYGF